MSLDQLAHDIHRNSVAHGFWPEREADRNVGEMLMLAVSELSEALEAHRDGQPPVWFEHQEGCEYHGQTLLLGAGCDCGPKPEGVAVEIIDCIIRCLDTLKHPDIESFYQIDLIMDIKMDYNANRPFKHGKAY